MTLSHSLSQKKTGVDDPGSEEKTVRMKRTPKQPSQREREEHERNHLPFRYWCAHCIKAKSRNSPHKREIDVMKSEVSRDDAMSTVSFDYRCFNDKLGKMTKEEYNDALSKKEKMNKPMVVVEDKETRTIVFCPYVFTEGTKRQKRNGLWWCPHCS